MEDNTFDLEEFRSYLVQLEKELSTGVKQTPDYHGEMDEILHALKRLTKEFKDKKYQQILPDLFSVLNFLNMLEEDIEDEFEEDDDYDDDEDFDDDEFDDDEDFDDDEEFDEDEDEDER